MSQYIRHTPELSRITSLPRRRVEDFPSSLPEELTAVLKTPGGTMSLRLAQALALYELLSGRENLRCWLPTSSTRSARCSSCRRG